MSNEGVSIGVSNHGRQYKQKHESKRVRNVPETAST